MRRILVSARVIAGISLLLAATIAGGCAGNGKNTTAAGTAAVSGEEREARLRAVVDEELAEARNKQGPGSEELRFDRPYFYKEYFEFPSGQNVYSLEFTETESRTTPLSAELEVEKTRFATRLSRNRDDAEADINYQRSQGIDYTSYEFHNGEWRRVGSLFLAQSTEENLGGEWKQIEERRAPILIEQERESWLQRLMFWN